MNVRNLDYPLDLAFDYPPTFAVTLFATHATSA